MMNRLMKKSAGYCGLVLGFSMIATGAQATVIASESNAYALGVDLSVEVNNVAAAQASFFPCIIAGHRAWLKVLLQVVEQLLEA